MTDSILFWNAVALEANRVSFSDPAKAQQQGPTLSSRALAIVHLAMYEAYARAVNNQGSFRFYVTGGFSPTLPASPQPALAVAGAAYRTLNNLYSAQSAFFAEKTSEFFLEFAFNNGSADENFQLGIEVAEKILEIRNDDPNAAADGYFPALTRYHHRVDPDNPGQGFHAPFYGSGSTLFAAQNRHSLDAPPQLAPNKKYLNALRQVRSKGIKPELNGTLPDKLSSPTFKAFDNRRTAEETLIGIYWGYDGSKNLGTPPRLYNQIVREVATAKNNDEGQNARLFALVNAAMGDAGILAWEQKYIHDFWRPVVGIREHDESFGPKAPQSGNIAASEDGDPNWLPLGAPATNDPTKKNFTPNFPAYPSGHATFGAAALHITRLFYGVGKTANGKYHKNGDLVADDLLDNLDGFVSEEFNGQNKDNKDAVRPRHVRQFKAENNNPSFSGGLGRMIIENGISRVFLGVHWSFDAFEWKDDKPDVSKTKVGGVPLGLEIAEDIFGQNGKAPVMSNTAPTAAAIAPAIEKASETTGIQRPYLDGISDR